MKTNEVKNMVIEALQDMKAKDIVTLDVTATSTFTDIMIICSGGSNRQVKAIAGEVIIRTKAANNPPLGVEGESSAEWVLVDLGDVVVHVMQQATRDFYQLEKLWDPELADD
ncbi:MAG: ribosome silencing factor [Gammaproteobacteria bacterium]|nr:MAG: ribosome silencing factor [Gammaproteobacteria bacterium]